MNSNCIRYGWWMAALTLWAACAPQPSSPPPAEARTDARSGEAEPTPQVSAPGDADASSPPESPPESASRFDPENPDWELRYGELFQMYASRFRAPSTDQPVTVVMANGAQREGVLHELTEDKLVLDVGNGRVTLTPDALEPDSASKFFATAYATQRAKARGRREVERWKREQASATPAPLPRQASSSPSTAGGRSSGGNPASTPGENGVDAVFSSAGPPVIPKNEGPDGRVRQVEDYIRKNAALPRSLRIKAWGRVQPHDHGYKVRVQYSLQSAGGLGISHEDMMFFMDSRGRVYRRAPVK